MYTEYEWLEIDETQPTESPQEPKLDPPLIGGQCLGMDTFQVLETAQTVEHPVGLTSLTAGW